MLLSLFAGASPASASTPPIDAVRPVAVEDGGAAPAAIDGFTDVPRSHPFWQQITWMVAKDLTSGYPDSTFRPTASVTRQSLAAFFARYYAAPSTACTSAPFSDVPVDHPFCPQITWLSSLGVTTGYPDGTFRPTDPVTRQSFAAMLYRIAGKPLGATPTCSVAPFSDVPTSHPFCGEIKWMVSRGVTEGYSDGTFRPSSVVSRQSSAAFLHRYRGAPKKIEGGLYFDCALFAQGTVRCWGENEKGAIGDGTTTDRTTATSVSGLTDAIDLSAGWGHACAVRKAGTVVCWGWNGQGQLGDGSTTDRTTPSQVADLTDAVKVFTGYETSCAVRSSGAVVCWGSNSNFKLGSGAGPAAYSAVPVAISGLAGVVDMSMGISHVCALLDSGSVKCWGASYDGQLGNGSTSSSVTPVSVSGISNAVALGGGRSHTCVALTSGTLRCWGDNENGQLGDGTTTDRLSPVNLSGLTGVVDVDGDEFGTCAVLGSGGGRCWGFNLNGAAGNGTQGTNVASPATVSSLSDAVQVARGADTACSLSADAKLRCWGRNGSGEVGDGTKTHRLVPVGVTGFS